MLQLLHGIAAMRKMDEKTATKEMSSNMNLFVLMMSKVTKDSLDIAQQTLKPLGSVQVRDAGYSIFVYEKQ